MWKGRRHLPAPSSTISLAPLRYSVRIGLPAVSLRLSATKSETVEPAIIIHAGDVADPVFVINHVAMYGEDPPATMAAMLKPRLMPLVRTLGGKSSQYVAITTERYAASTKPSTT